MPYAANEELPPSVRHHLPAHAQDIYRAAFNNAWARYADRGRAGQEEVAHRVAWGAVKRRYRKTEEGWVAAAAGSGLHGGVG
jgi:cation transport regulator